MHIMCISVTRGHCSSDRSICPSFCAVRVEIFGQSLFACQQPVCGTTSVLSWDNAVINASNGHASAHRIRVQWSPLIYHDDRRPQLERPPHKSVVPSSRNLRQICQAASIGGTGAHKAGAPNPTSLHFKSSDFSSLSRPTLVCSSSFPDIVTPLTTILTPVSRYSQASCHNRHSHEDHEGICVPRARGGRRHARSHRRGRIRCARQVSSSLLFSMCCLAKGGHVRLPYSAGHAFQMGTRLRTLDHGSHTDTTLVRPSTTLERPACSTVPFQSSKSHQQYKFTPWSSRASTT